MIVRTLFSGKWLVLSVFAIAAIVICMLAAMWQWNRGQEQLLVEQAGLAAPAPIGDVLSSADSGVPAGALGRQVVVVGKYLPDAQTLVRSRLSEQDEPGFWVVNAVQAADGSIIAVLRGWSRDQKVSPASGPVTVAGRVQPDENFYSDAPLPVNGHLVTITRAGLLADWQEPIARAGGAKQLVPGFVASTSISPSSGQISALVPLIGTDPEIGFPWRNVLYSLQWLVFAGFVILIWVRWFREDIREANRSESEPAWQGSDRDRVSLDS